MAEHEWVNDWKKAPGNKGHYSGGIQPIEYFACAYPDAIPANIIKYAIRHGKKNGAEDIKKALWYLDWLIKLEDKSHTQDVMAGDFIASQEALSDHQKEVVLLLEEISTAKDKETMSRYICFIHVRDHLEAMLAEYK